jgi:hypothetical protein
VTVKVNVAEVEPAGIVTWKGVPDKVYILLRAEPPAM